MTTPNPYSPPRAAVDTTAAQAVAAAPPLWNPNAAASWSILFTPIFGAFLQMKNWQALGEPVRADASRKWAIGSTVFLLALIAAGVVLPEDKAIDSASRAIGFAFLITWYYSNGKEQNAFVLARYGKDYPRRGWLKPVLAALGSFVGLMAVVFLVAVVAEILFGRA
jgi:hypothetical protein